ncbi:MAG: hypothetical protein A3J24_03680 [Deltaproteobacteria bacterium RIFCSPLOWO2_02_FULL_53_8]|nr:MAG: hypothetical protein A3J24_03680 [Deltaproteobacteria bacterium RIFCSPLOWO2_02_FULL_53_8]
MLEHFRNKQKSIIILLVFAAIIIVFVFWGVGPTGQKSTEDMAVAKVNGELISGKEYIATYKRHVDYYKQMFKENYTDEIAKSLKLKEKSLDILINKKLVLDDANDRGMKITDNELQDTIKNIDAFKKDGVFDLETYKRLLSANRLTPAEYEQSLQGDLLYNKIAETIIKDITVTDAEIADFYKKEARKYTYDYVTISTDSYVNDAAVTQDEAKDYLKKNASSYLEPLRLNAFYIKAEISQFDDKVKVTSADIKEYYDKNPKQFEMPEKVAAAHILLPIDPSAKDKARTKAQELIKKIKAGEEFAALAKKHSVDTSSALRGGDLGWFQRGDMVGPFEEAAFSLKKGEVSGIVETAFGLHIIKVYDKQEPQTAPLKEVEPQIKSIIAKEKAWKECSEAILATIKPFSEAKTVAELKKIAAQRGFSSAETGLITETDRKSPITADDTLRDTVFTLRPGEVSRPLQSNQTFYLVKAVERIDPSAQDFAKAGPGIIKLLKAQKAAEAAKKKAEEVLNTAVSKKELASIAKAERLKVEQSEPFSIQQPVMKKLRISASDKPKFFETTKEAPVYPYVIQVGTNFYVMKLNSTKEADMAEFEKIKESVKENLLAKKRNDAADAWIKGLRDKAKIEIFSDRL